MPEIESQITHWTLFWQLILKAEAQHFSSHSSLALMPGLVKNHFQLAILPFISKFMASASEPARVTIPSFTK
jgi:hypothetical protein